jgi:hypothetical protein
MVDFTIEDVAFCLKAREAGYKIFIDPAAKEGHEKKVGKESFVRAKATISLGHSLTTNKGMVSEKQHMMMHYERGILYGVTCARL